MPQKKRTPGRRSEPKLFKCTGFGNCDMVFTRSEHLARHARKHTGEKPFRCVVPNCDRMFSRFDNMMQHTHTHNRPKKKDSCDSSEGKLSPLSVPEDLNMAHVPSLSSSPVTSTIMMNNKHHHLPNEEEKPASFHQQLTPPTSEKDFIKYKHCTQQRYSSSESISSPAPQDQSQCNLIYRNTPLSPSHSSTMIAPLSPAAYPSSLTTLNTAQLAAPKPFSSSVAPSDYSKQSRPQARKGSIHSETSFATTLKRRLSYVDLSTPIQELGHSYSTPSFCSSSSSDITSDEEEAEEEAEEGMSSCQSSRFKANGIDITYDEFEALQGFGKFCSEPVVREPILMTRITTSPTCSVSFPIKLPPLRCVSPTAAISNNTTSQVHAFRQQITTTHESFSRFRTSN